ncbi:MAG: exonuclease SbcCD subunit D C-terminal domain-containing protein [Lentisphaeraceae bacterium]|nr:exonuclease SbcCD subunit D C-terminal domain-containing protein [Lentisphaeraceae bacterium]
MFRFLHTSDWHLGQSFINRSREEEHKNFLTWLLNEIETLKIDALIVAGDIFDTGTPPSYARHLYFDFLKELNLRCSSCQVIIVGGNHDSVSTLNESSTLLKLLNIHVISGNCSAEDETILLQNQDSQDAAIVCAVPFLRERDVRLSNEGETIENKREALRRGIKQHYGKTLERAQEINKQVQKDLPIVATGHLTTSGGELTDGVRDIYIGSLESYSSGDFPEEFDYVALGHLHKEQSFGAKKHIRYCGSPIPMSFPEAKHPKIVHLVEIDADKNLKVENLQIPTSRILKSISGSLEEIQSDLLSLNDEKKLTTWVEIVINSEIEISAAQSLVKDICKDLPIEILRFRRERKKKNGNSSTTEKEVTLKEMTIEEVFERKLASAEFDSKILDQLKDAFKEIHQKALSGEDS